MAIELRPLEQFSIERIVPIHIGGLDVSYTNAAPPSGTSRFDAVIGGGLAPSPVVGRVQLDGNGGTRDVVIGANPDSFLSPKGTAPKAAFRQPKGRVYWFIQK